MAEESDFDRAVLEQEVRGRAFQEEAGRKAAEAAQRRAALEERYAALRMRGGAAAVAAYHDEVEGAAMREGARERTRLMNEVLTRQADAAMAELRRVLVGGGGRVFGFGTGFPHVGEDGESSRAPGVRLDWRPSAGLTRVASLPPAPAPPPPPPDASHDDDADLARAVALSLKLHDTDAPAAGLRAAAAAPAPRAGAAGGSWGELHGGHAAGGPRTGRGPVDDRDDDAAFRRELEAALAISASDAAARGPEPAAAAAPQGALRTAAPAAPPSYRSYYS